MIGRVKAGGNRLHDGWCLALMYELGHQVGWDELHDFVMRQL